MSLFRTLLNFVKRGGGKYFLKQRIQRTQNLDTMKLFFMKTLVEKFNLLSFLLIILKGLYFHCFDMLRLISFLFVTLS